MKRTTIFISMLVLLLSLGLVSCDAMFETNLFAKMTHPEQSAADISAKTPDQMQEYTNSAFNLKTLVDNPDLKTAALEKLATYYADPAAMGSSDAQTAAIVAAEIAIKTVPEAAGLSGSILAFVSNKDNKISTDTTTDVTNMVTQVLPKEIADTLAGGGDMPQAFTEMIDAFVLANDAFQALGTGIGTGATYADGTSVSSVEQQSIAVNAIIAGLLSAVTPAVIADPVAGPTSEEIATGLWIALSDPTTVAQGAASPPITINIATFGNLIGTGTDPGPVSNLLTASGMGELFTSSSTGDN